MKYLKDHNYNAITLKQMDCFINKTCKIPRKSVEKSIKGRMVKVIQLDLNENFIREWEAAITVQREIKIRKSIIKFKKTAPRNLAVKDELLQLIIQTYKITGEKNISEDFEEKLTVYIKKIDEKVLMSQLKYAPVWIQKRIKNRYLS